MNKTGFIVAAVAAIGLIFVISRPSKQGGPEPTPMGQGSCADKLDRAALEKSLELGTQFLMANQKEAGNFTYEYDWKAKTFTKGDSQVRQAGAVWGLGLIMREKPTQELEDKLHKSLKFFRDNSQLTDLGRFVVYPGDPEGSTGTVSLLALALIDALRSESELLDATEREAMKTELDEYLTFLLSQRRPDGLFHSKYRNADGVGFSQPSPYFDGESMLALVKAAKYHGRDDLWDAIMESAEAGRTKYIVEARKQDPDSNQTKGFYQWSSMTFFEIATSGREGVDTFGDTLIELADWMIDVHRTLKRQRNTAYAYEGIIHAYQMAKLRENKEKEAKFRCVIEQGLEKLTSWQIGHPLANAHIGDVPPDDPLAVGGIQNHAEEAPLRIDVTQHQMHAVILALEYVFTG